MSGDAICGAGNQTFDFCSTRLQLGLQWPVCLQNHYNLRTIVKRGSAEIEIFVLRRSIICLIPLFE